MTVPTLLAFGVALFVATNVDDLFLLLAWFAERRAPAREIAVGQVLGQGLILAASLLVALAVLAIAAPWVRVAGLLPLAVGVRRVVALARGGMPPDLRRTSTARGVAGVGLLTAATGGDNLGAYAPVFATQSRADAVGLVVVSLAMTALWIVLAWGLARHPRSAAFLVHYGTLLVPIVLIAIGLRILTS